MGFVDLQLYKKYLKHILLTELVHLLLPKLIFLIFTKHSNQYLFHQHTWTLHFDAYHYFYNSYQFQPNHAFFTPFVYLIRILKYYIGQNGTIWLILTINRILFLLGLNQLHKIFITLSKFKNHQFINTAMLVYLYNPSSIFFHSIYTESLYVFFSFIAIKSYLQSQSIYKTTFFLFLAGLLRSNAIFLSPIIGLTILQNFIKHINTRRSWRYLLEGLIIGTILILPILFHLLFCYYNICIKNTEYNKTCQKNWYEMYSYVQNKYWNVGFLNYFKISNLIFIAIGTPSIIIAIYGTKLYYRNFLEDKLRGILLSFVLLLLVIVGWTNIQSSTRFLSTHPLFYYILANLSLKYKVVRVWILFYYLIGIFFYTLAFPWT